eukprot:661880-Prymnesium_polylepis.1
MWLGRGTHAQTRASRQKSGFTPGKLTISHDGLQHRRDQEQEEHRRRAHRREFRWSHSAAVTALLRRLAKRSCADTTS